MSNVQSLLARHFAWDRPQLSVLKCPVLFPVASEVYSLLECIGAWNECEAPFGVYGNAGDTQLSLARIASGSAAYQCRSGAVEFDRVRTDSNNWCLLPTNAVVLLYFEMRPAAVMISPDESLGRNFMKLEIGSSSIEHADRLLDHILSSTKSRTGFLDEDTLLAQRLIADAVRRLMSFSGANSAVLG